MRVFMKILGYFWGKPTHLSFYSGYNKKKNILYLFLLTLFFYRLETKGCVLWKKQDCPFCGRKFMRFKSLLDHMVLKHGQRSNFEKYVNMRNKLILDDIKRRFVN